MMMPGKRHKIIFKISRLILLILLLTGGRALAQEKQLEGLIVDKDTKARIAGVSITNLSTQTLTFNNLKGEFKVAARPGDKLVFFKEYYFADTIQVKTMDNLIVYLPRNAIMLHEVMIRDSLHTPMQRLLATRREYSKAYGSSAYNNPFSTVPGGGAGINLDAIYNALSKSGRNAQHLQGLIQHDYEQNVIDYRFNRGYVANITKLKGDELTEFMTRYRPSYYTVNADTEYEFVAYIRTSLRRFLKNKKTYTQPLSKPPQS